MDFLIRVSPSICPDCDVLVSGDKPWLSETGDLMISQGETINALFAKGHWFTCYPFNPETQKVTAKFKRHKPKA